LAAPDFKLAFLKTDRKIAPPIMESEDKQTKLFMDLWKWVDTHRKHVAFGAILVVLVAVWVGFYLWHESQKESSANQALSRVIHQTLNEEIQVQSLDALVKVASEHPNTSAAQRALLLAGANFFTEGKYADAKAQFERSLREFPNTPLSSQALFGVAVILESQGKTNEALTTYKEVIDRYPTDNVVPQSRLALGRLNEAQGKLTHARDFYLQIERTEAGTIGTQATMRLKELFEKHPELIPVYSAPTPAPTPAPTNAPVLKLNRP
jgi:predicted negative regulator of RcsB-dependent stress response